MNYLGVVCMCGIELEVYYVSMCYYVMLSWVCLYISVFVIEFVNLEDIIVLFDCYWMLDVGGCWWQQCVQVGLCVEYFGFIEEGYDFFQICKIGGIGVFFDFYVSFKFQFSIMLWLNIENLQNKVYDNNVLIDSIFSLILDRGNGCGCIVLMGVNVVFQLLLVVVVFVCVGCNGQCVVDVWYGD